MRVLVVHNFYRSEQPSGENAVVLDEVPLLREHGVEVHTLSVQSDQIAEWPRARRAMLPGRVVWSRAGSRAVADAVERSQADVVHFHNTFPLLSPAAFRAAHRTGVPVVNTLHNYRPICPAGILYRDGHVCEDCVGLRAPLPAVLHSCYRGSRLATVPVTAMDGLHAGIGTWRKHVDAFVALSGFARDTYLRAGWDPRQMVVKYNTAQDRGVRRSGPGDGFVCLARLQPEKGVDVLLRAWGIAFPDGGQALRIIGSGDCEAELRALVSELGLQGVEFLGHVEPAEALAAVEAARAVVQPSTWYEGFPRTVVEAYSMGVPMIASRIGSLTELVEDEVTGLQADPGSPESLAQALIRLAESDELSTRLGAGARLAYEQRYSPSVTTTRLIEVYRCVAEGRPLPGDPAGTAVDSGIVER